MWTVKVYVNKECIESYTYNSYEDAIAKREELKQKCDNVILLKEPSVWNKGLLTIDAFVSFVFATIEAIFRTIFR